MQGYLPWALGGIAFGTLVVPLLYRGRGNVLVGLLLYPSLVVNYVSGFFALMYLWAVKLDLAAWLGDLLDVYGRWCLGLMPDGGSWLVFLLMMGGSLVLLIGGELLILAFLTLFPFLTLALYGYAQRGLWRVLGLVTDRPLSVGSAGYGT